MATGFLLMFRLQDGASTQVLLKPQKFSQLLQKHGAAAILNLNRQTRFAMGARANGSLNINQVGNKRESVINNKTCFLKHTVYHFFRLDVVKFFLFCLV